MEILERISKIEEEIYLLTQEDSDKVRRIPLIRIPVSDNNYLGVSLTIAPSKSDPSKKSLFITFHTVKPKNRINLNRFSLVDEMHALLKNMLELKYTGWLEYFMKYFKPTSSMESKFSKLKLQSQVFNIEENLEWNKINIDLQEIENLKFEDVDVQNILKQTGLENMTLEEIEEELNRHIKEGKWIHFVLFKTENLYLTLSITRYGNYVFGITTGNPINYLKLKNYDYVGILYNLIKIFKYLMEKHPIVRNTIINYIK